MENQTLFAAPVYGKWFSFDCINFQTKTVFTLICWKNTPISNPIFWRAEAVSCKLQKQFLTLALSSLDWIKNAPEEQITKKKKKEINKPNSLPLKDSLHLAFPWFLCSQAASEITAVWKQHWMKHCCSDENYSNNFVELQIITVMLAWFWKMTYLRNGETEKIMVSRMEWVLQSIGLQKALL